MLVSGRNADVSSVRQLYDQYPYPKPFIETEELASLDSEATRSTIRARVQTHLGRRNREFAAKHRMDALTATGGKGLRVLDAGCGTGVLTAQLASLLPEAEITAVDMTDASLVLAQKTMEIAGFDHVSVAKADLMDAASLPEGSFDHVFSLGVVHVTPDPARVLGNLGGLLAPGGQLTTFVYDIWGRKLESLLNRFTVTLSRNDPAIKERIIRSFALDRNSIRKEETVLERVSAQRRPAGLAQSLLPPLLFDGMRRLWRRVQGGRPRGPSSWNGNWDAFAHPCVHALDVEGYWEMHEQAGLDPVDVWFGSGVSDFRGLLAGLLRERGMSDVDVSALSDREVYSLAECLITPRQLFFRATRRTSANQSSDSAR